MYTQLGIAIDPATVFEPVAVRCPGGDGSRCGGAQTLPEIAVWAPSATFPPRIKDTTVYAPTAPTTFPAGTLQMIPWPLVIGTALAAILLLRKR